MWLSQWTRQLLVIGLFVTCSGFAIPVFGEIRTDFLMDSDPELNLPEPVNNFSPALKSLWFEALKRPEADMQRMAAETIARGHLYGVPDLKEAIPQLETLLLSDKSHPATRFAAARALIVLDSRDSSDKLLQASQKYEADLRQLIEPALAQWTFAPAVEMWKARLENSETRLRDLGLAVQGLGKVRDSSAAPKLMAIVKDETRGTDLRLKAAEAAGQCVESGLEADAARFAHSKPKPLSVNSICACHLLARHDSEEAKKLLSELATHPQPIVAAHAMNRLLELDSKLVLPLAESAMNHTDPRVRLAGATALLRNPTTERIVAVKPLLNDPHPSVRRSICDDLVQLSNQSVFVEPIHAAALDLLAQDEWQGQEQASLLAGMLEFQPASKRLVELLESPRAEVRIATAWALRKIADQETIPAIIDKINRETERRQKISDPIVDVQVAHLCEALGVLKANEGVPTLRQYIPKGFVTEDRSRCAAIWAIGLIKEGQRDSEVEASLYARVNDFSETDPELDSVKEKSGITLARMKAVDLASDIRDIALSDQVGSRLKLSLRWAVKELTGEDLPPVAPERRPSGSWFLEPINR